MLLFFSTIPSLETRGSQWDERKFLDKQKFLALEKTEEGKERHDSDN